MFLMPPKPNQSTRYGCEQQHGQKITNVMAAAGGGFFQNRHTAI